MLGGLRGALDGLDGVQGSEAQVSILCLVVVLPISGNGLCIGRHVYIPRA